MSGRAASWRRARAAAGATVVAAAAFLAIAFVAALRAMRAGGHEPYVWKNVAIHGGGFVTGLVFSPTERDLLYARTDIGGAYRWDPRSRTWNPLLDWVGRPDWNLQGVESLATDPVEPNRLYVAAGTYTNPDVGFGEMLLSSDYGRSWRRVSMPFRMGANEAGRGSGERLAVDPRKNSILYFGSRRDGLWQSTDYGVRWRKVETFPDLPDGSAAYQSPRASGAFNYLAQAVGIVFVLFDALSGRPGEATPVIFAAVSRSGESLFRSRDAGRTWEAVAGQPARFRPIRADLSSDGSLFVTYGDEPGPNRMGDGAVFRFDTRRGDWTDITPERPDPAHGSAFGYAAVSVDRSDPATLVVSTWHREKPFDEIFRSVDRGATWKPMLDGAAWDHSAAPYTSTMRHHWMSAVVIDPFDRDRILFTTGYGIWGTPNASDSERAGATRWSFDDRGLEETVPLALLSPPRGAHLISGLGDIDGFRHDDLDTSPPQGRFDAPGFKNTEWLDVAGQAPEVVVRSGTTYGNDRILGALSRNGAAHWMAFPSEPPRQQPGDHFGTGPICVSADGSGFLWTVRGSAPYLTRDDGKSWRVVAGAPVDLRLVADRVDPTRFYGYDPIDGLLYSSSDGGSSVEVVRRGLPARPAARGWRPPSDLRAVPERTGELWLAVEHRLFRIASYGREASAIPSVEEASAVGFGKGPEASSYPAVFIVGKVAGYFGIFRSDDRGATWIRLGDDAHRYGSVSSVIGDPRIFGRVYLATGGRGIVYGDRAP